MEYCPETILDQKTSRYHKIEPNFEVIEKSFVEFFLESYKKPPLSIILDMDVTDDQVHGNQEGAFLIVIITEYVMLLYIFSVGIIY